jgi:hypothetical protein
MAYDHVMQILCRFTVLVLLLTSTLTSVFAQDRSEKGLLLIEVLNETQSSEEAEVLLKNVDIDVGNFRDYFSFNQMKRFPPHVALAILKKLQISEEDVSIIREAMLKSPSFIKLLNPFRSSDSVLFGFVGLALASAMPYLVLGLINYDLSNLKDPALLSLSLVLGIGSAALIPSIIYSVNEDGAERALNWIPEIDHRSNYRKTFSSNRFCIRKLIAISHSRT